MRSRIIIPFFFFIFLGFHILSIAQFTQEELAERSKWEEYLKDAEIVNSYQLILTDDSLILSRIKI